jgi:hypothetical protein
MNEIRKLLVGALIFGVGVQSSLYDTAQAQSDEPESGFVVCAPDIYLITPDNCLPAGPSEYLAEMSQLGLDTPPRPLQYSMPDPGLTYLPFDYFHLENDFLPILDLPAGNSIGQAFPPGFVYVTYTDRTDTGAGIYYLLSSGGWILGKGSRVSVISNFQGLEFDSTPRRAFGWAFEVIPILQLPGFNQPETGKYLSPFVDILQVYDTDIVNGVEWHLIGLNQWVEARKVAIVYPNTTPPDGVTTSRWIDVDLAEQTLAVYENNQLIFATVIASGLEPYWTKPGLFNIYIKKETETMRNNNPAEFYYLDNVPWTMYFDGARALHGAYWRTRFGYPQSHGCVNLSVGDSHWLFNWAHEGDWVYIHDPSGLTPTDPAQYNDWAY